MSLDLLPQPVSTVSRGEINHEYEDFILEESVGDVSFPHWTAHLREFWGWYEEEPEYCAAEADVPLIRETISDGLWAAGYRDFARDIAAAESDAAINSTLFAQYTTQSNLYGEVNTLLRTAHSGASLRGHSLVPWILQFNCALRLQPIFDGVAYRGADMTNADVDQYQPGLMFEWAGFISASKERETALDFRGSALFDITPWGSYSMYGKRNSFDIARYSVLPGEQEVVFPIACTYRVTNVQKDGRRTLISLQSIDQY